MTKKIGIIQPHFFPWLGFYCLMKEVDTLVWLDDVQIGQKSFQNRVQVNTPHGLNWIKALYKKNIPRKERLFKNLEILKNSDWKENNLNILSEGYRKTKNFELIKKIYNDTVEKDQFLEILISSCIKPASILNVVPASIFLSSDLKIKSTSSNRILEIVKYLDGNKYITGHGSLNYLDHDKFEKNDINVFYLDYKINRWPQPKNYIYPYVSILDFISCSTSTKNYKLNYNLVNWKSFKKNFTKSDKKD
tara:strand:+ start:1940 stop:2683 length:744 start_codon:yes stop_codon:yes gene_type:complete